MLASWPKHIIDRLEILASAFSDQKPYAVFDADGTLWDHDLSEALLVFLENRNIISSTSLPATMLPLPRSRGESLFAYYLRLCQADVSLGYFWLCQAFAGFSLGELKAHIDDLLSSDDPLTYTLTGQSGPKNMKEIDHPGLFQWQQELITFLKQKGIRVYVLTASQEELVRMVVADPRYGYHIAPENVIGMRLAVRTSDGDRLLMPDEKILDTTYYNSTLTHSLSGITTWHESKVAAIRAYIEPVKRPVLVAGNSESDFEMLCYAQNVPGMRIFVSKDAGCPPNVGNIICSFRQSNQKEPLTGLTENGWEIVDPAQF